MQKHSETKETVASKKYDVIVIGGGSAGISVSVSASLLRRKPELALAIVEPAESHFYQPAWTLVGAGSLMLPARSGRWLG